MLNHWAHLGPMVAQVGPMLGYVGTILGPCWAYVGPMLAYVGPMWPHVEPSWELCWGHVWAYRARPQAQNHVKTDFLEHAKIKSVATEGPETPSKKNNIF